MLDRLTATALPLAIALTALLPAPPAAAPQEPPGGTPQDDPAEEPVGHLALALEARKSKLLEKLPGAWRLVDFIHVTNDRGESTIVGAMLVTEGVMSLNIHATAPQYPNISADRLVQAGLYYWHLADDLRFEASTLMAHSNMDGAALTIEQPWIPSVFDIELLTDNDLRFTRQDGSRLEFERMDTKTFPLEAQRMLELIRSGRYSKEDLLQGERPFDRGRGGN